MAPIESDLELAAEGKKYLNEFLQDLEEVEVLILKLNENAEKSSVLRKVSRLVHSMKGTSGSYGFSLLSTVCHKTEDALVRSEHLSADTLIDDFLALKDVMTKICLAYRDNDSQVITKIKEQFESTASASHISTPTKNTIDSQKVRILVGESSNLLTNTLLKILSEYDVEISNSKDGYDLLGRLLREKFDILISSIHLPTIDSISILKILEIISTTNKEIRTAIITSSRQQIGKIQKTNLIMIEKGASFEENIRQQLKSWDISKKQPEANFFTKNCKVLAIDDSADIQKLIKIGLKKFPNIHLINCEDPRDAESQALSERPDLILLDVQMPYISGDQLLVNFQKNRLLENIPIVFLTATDEERELSRLSALRPTAIWKKPFSPGSLVKNITKILNK